MCCEKRKATQKEINNSIYKGGRFQRRWGQPPI